MDVNISWRYSERQNEADEAEEPILLYGGAKGGGKSFWLCRWAVRELMLFKGNRGFLGRKRSVDFTNTTLETFKKAVDNNLFRINEQKKKIFFPCFDGVIDYGGLDNTEEVEKFNSAEYGFIGVDQAEEISRDAFAMLLGTRRHKLKDGSLPSFKTRMTANPAQCWLKDDFILTQKPGHRFIKALPTDNPFLAKGYIDNLKAAFEYRPELLNAYLYGSWDDLAGGNLVCQVSWVNDAKNIQVYGPVNKCVVVCDVARFGDDETVIYVIQQKNVAEVIDVEILSHKTLMDTAGRLIAKRRQFGASQIAVDGIGVGAGVVDALNEAREPVLEIVSSRKPLSPNDSKYVNLKSQMWMEAGKKIFEKKVKVPDDSILAGQLASPIYEYHSTGVFKVESKDKIKERLGRSPDRADSFIMGLYALDQVRGMDAIDYEDRTKDRVGHGVAVGVESSEFDFTPFPDNEMYEVGA